MKTKTEILAIAKAQLALDYSCQLSDFEKEGNTIVESKLMSGRRIYRSDGCFLKMLCFGGRLITSTAQEMIPWCEEKLLNRDSAWIFEFPKLRTIDNKLQEFGHEIADIHHYYLPKSFLLEIKPTTEIKWFELEDIKQFIDDDRFGEAFAFSKSHPDILAVAAIEDGNIMGMAGASADSVNMWQIGIDVLPEYRGRGIGTNLVGLLRDEILKRGKVPFYGTVESHIHSQGIAVNAGFFPAWAELHSKAK
jgi:GNAT superfamily N-acetyltransferase